MVKPYLYFAITNNCNYECRHCFMEAGPGQKDTTIEEKDFRKVIKNLPKVSLDLELGGGEVFTIKNTLYSYLDYINYENKRRKRKGQGPIHPEVQTNGFWAVNENRIKSIFSELASFDVTGIDIASHDKYHQEQGANLKGLERLAGLALETGFFDDVTLKGCDRKETFPLGRAKTMNLRLSKMFHDYDVCEGSLDQYFLSIIFNGNVYSCPVTPRQLPGNVIREPLVDIVRRARKDPRLKLLNDKGIKGLALSDGWKKKDIRAKIKKNGRCGFCIGTYGCKGIQF